MKNILKSTLVLAVVVVAGLASAQGRGQFRMFGGMGQSASGLIGRADVQRDLNVTTEQKDQFAKLRQEQMDAMRARFMSGAGAPGGGAPGGGGPGRFTFTPEMRAELEKAMKEADAKVATILTPEQNKRLKEIRIQLSKNSAIFQEDVQKDLGLSEETIKKAKDLQAGAQKANGEVQTKIRNQEIEQADGRAIMSKNNDALEAELGKLLTADQAAKLKAMGGAEFKADPPQQGGFGGGGGL